MTVGDRPKVVLWDLATGEVGRFDDHPDVVWSLAAARRPPGGDRGPGQVARAATSAIRLRDLPSGATKRLFVGHTSIIAGLAFSPDGTRLFSTSYDRTVRAWDVTSGARAVEAAGARVAPGLGGLTRRPPGRHRHLRGHDHPARRGHRHPVQIAPRVTGPADSLAFLPGGRGLVSVPPEGEHDAGWSGRSPRAAWCGRCGDTGVRCRGWSFPPTAGSPRPAAMTAQPGSGTSPRARGPPLHWLLRQGPARELLGKGPRCSLRPRRPHTVGGGLRRLAPALARTQGLRATPRGRGMHPARGRGRAGRSLLPQIRSVRSFGSVSGVVLVPPKWCSWPTIAAWCSPPTAVIGITRAAACRWIAPASGLPRSALRRP